MKTTAYLITAFMMLTSLTVFAQGGRGNRNASFNDRTTCTNVIPDLTQEQIRQITSLESAHKSQMDQLRNERRSTRDNMTKDDVRAKMIQIRDAHRDQVKQLLTPEQQRVYETLPYRGYEGQTPANRSRGNGRNYCL
ncbi:MAG: hypothetical protein PHV64_05855 [Bacteroidales bacterium]|nr:hypothetical protein [Bacteroidales bacterium]